MRKTGSAKRVAVVLPPGQERSYPMGRIRAVFRPTGTKQKAHTRFPSGGSSLILGPGAHSDEEDDAFYVIEGTMSFLMGERWIDAPKGSFLLASGGVSHDFENRT